MPEIAGIDSDEYVCEIGAGTGATTQYLVDAVGDDGYMLVTEPSDNMFAQLSSQLDTIDHENMDVAQKPAESVSSATESVFDHIVGNFVLTHIDLDATLDEADDMLAEDGKVAISFFSKVFDPQPQDDFYDAFESNLNAYADENNRSFNNPFEEQYRFDDLHDIAHRNGFDLEDTNVYTTEPFDSFSLGFDVFIRRNFHQAFPELDRETAIEEIKDVAVTTYEEEDGYEFGVTYLQFMRE
jgi:ubiquinone/menaquinone biosynthesis C-methylase UbiE